MENREEILQEIKELAQELEQTNPLNSFYLTGELVELAKQLQKTDLKLSKVL